MNLLNILIKLLFISVIPSLEAADGSKPNSSAFASTNTGVQKADEKYSKNNSLILVTPGLLSKPALSSTMSESMTTQLITTETTPKCTTESTTDTTMDETTTEVTTIESTTEKTTPISSTQETTVETTLTTQLTTIDYLKLKISTSNTPDKILLTTISAGYVASTETIKAASPSEGKYSNNYISADESYSEFPSASVTDEASKLSNYDSLVEPKKSEEYLPNSNVPNENTNSYPNESFEPNISEKTNNYPSGISDYDISSKNSNSSKNISVNVDIDVNISIGYSTDNNSTLKPEFPRKRVITRQLVAGIILIVLIAVSAASAVLFVMMPNRHRFAFGGGHRGQDYVELVTGRGRYRPMYKYYDATLYVTR